jgi:hypothetical protein
MSAIDKLRSFAEARCDDHEIIKNGLTYGDAREVTKMLTPEDQSDPTIRAIEELELTVRRTRDDDGTFTVTSDMRPLEEIGEDEPIGIHADRPFEMLVHALYHGYVQEHDIGACDWEDYLSDVVDLLQRIHERGDHKVPERRRELDS